MCFYNGDYDWTAQVVVEQETTTGKRRCDECFTDIPEGQTARFIGMQEYEECRACDNGDCECPRNADGDPVCQDTGCQCDEPDFGESCDYCRCDNCDKFLKAVQAAELEAGCGLDESLPPLCQMTEHIGRGYGDMDEAKKYFKTALKMFPELKANGHLAKLWNKMF